MSPYPVFLCGDQIEFEREHAKTPPEERPDWPLPSFDARDWAKAFCRRFMVLHREGYNTRPVDDDEGVMLTWFANALMRGYDERTAKEERPPISISHREGRWYCECPLIPELNASSVTLYALLHAMADRVNHVIESAITTAQMARVGHDNIASGEGR